MPKSHGLTGTREYRIWVQMRRRCRDPKASGYQNYGGRGIRVCDRWEKSFETFLKDMGPCPNNYSIERKNGDGNYEPGNCTWASHVTQNNNRRSNVKLTHKGETLTVRQWSRRLGISHMTIHSRIQRGLSVEKVLYPNVRARNALIEIDGKCKTLAQWADHVGISYLAIYARWRNGERGSALVDPPRVIALTIDDETKSLRQWAIEKGVNYHTAYSRYNRGLTIKEIFDV